MKTCTKCSIEQDDKEFFFKNKAQGKRGTICRLCQREYTKKHYQNHKQDYLDKAKASNTRMSEFVNDYKSKHPCIKCGESEPVCLDFHHLDPAIKDSEISFMVGSASKARIVEEINKCVVLCSNCHRKLHKGLIVLGTSTLGG